MRANGTLANTVLQGKVERKRSRERPARQWLDDVNEWTRLSLNEMGREPKDRVAWRKHVCASQDTGYYIQILEYDAFILVQRLYQCEK